jgi:hypothetical protein
MTRTSWGPRGATALARQVPLKPDRISGAESFRVVPRMYGPAVRRKAEG